MRLAALKAMKRISLIGTLILLALVQPATAGTLNAIINGKSYHVDASRDWNESNYGLGLEYQFESSSRWRTSAMANGFRDSNDHMSYMAGGSLHRRLFESARAGGLYLDVGVTAFVMTREDVNGNRPFPGVLPSLALGNRHLGLNLAYLPEAGVRQFTGATFEDPTIKGVVYLQLKVNIDSLRWGAN